MTIYVNGNEAGSAVFPAGGMGDSTYNISLAQGVGGIRRCQLFFTCGAKLGH